MYYIMHIYAYIDNADQQIYTCKCKANVHDLNPFPLLLQEPAP